MYTAASTIVMPKLCIAAAIVIYVFLSVLLHVFVYKCTAKQAGKPAFFNDYDKFRLCRKA